MTIPGKNKTKNKVGRPLRRQSPADQILTIRLTATEKQVLRDFCWRYDTSASDAVRDAMAVMGIIPDWF